MQLRLQQPKIQTKIITAVARFLTITNGKPSKIRHYNERERERIQNSSIDGRCPSHLVKEEEKNLYSSELYSLDSGSTGTAAQQNDSLSLRRRQLPSEFHFRSVMVNCGRGIFTQ